MKKVFKDLMRDFIFATTICIVLAFIVVTVAKNEDKFFIQEHNTEQVLDSTKIVSIIESYNNESWSNVSELQFYLSKTSENHLIDSMFYSIPYESIINVSTILLNNNDKINKRMIVEEYNKNIRIYSLLPKHDIQQSNLKESYNTEKDSDTITNKSQIKL